jgi:hypothetical protein
MKRKLLALIFIWIGFLNSWAQNTTVGGGAFASNVFGPAYTSVNANSISRVAYIYSSSLLSTLQVGDTITSFSFQKATAGTIQGATNLKIYMRPTVKTDFGTGALNWNNELQGIGFKKVVETNLAPLVPNTTGFVTVPFDTAFRWDTLFGKNLEVLIEYYQPLGTTANISWAIDNNNSQVGYLDNQCKYSSAIGTAFADSLVNSSSFKPVLRINHPRFDTELSVVNLYSLGKIPAPLGNPDTVKAIIQNVGKKAISSHKVYLKSEGANDFLDSVLVSNLAVNASAWITFPIRNIQNVGMDTLQVIISADGDSSNNVFEGLREATEFVYSYRNLQEPPAPGGIGFNGGTGDFVAKFQSTDPKAINQIVVTFGFGGQPFRIGIWDATGSKGQPGALLWQSSVLTSVGGNFTVPVWPPVSVNGNFFVGVRQTGTSNVAFGYQSEVPVRQGTFFYAAPTGDTNWVDFSPDAPFRFLIEPRIQAQNDVTAVSVLQPKDTLFFGQYATIAPKAVIRNIGSNDQLVPFDVTCLIKYAGAFVQYSSTISDTLSSGASRTISFDSTFLPTSFGDYTVEIITRLANDQFKQNDTTRSVFHVGILNDVGPTTVFEPGNGFEYELNIDTVYPLVKIDNFGFDAKSFASRAQISDSAGNIVWQTDFVHNIGGINSQLASYDPPFAPKFEGRYTFRAFTRLNTDVRRQNDTVTRTFRVIKSNDVAPNLALLPSSNQKFPFPTNGFKPSVEIVNLGEDNQVNPFPIFFEVYKDSVLLYVDSFKTQIQFNQSKQIVFDSIYTPTEVGNYKALFYTALSTDQLKTNDSIWIDFVVGIENDIEVLGIELFPIDSVLNLSEKYRPRVHIANNGFKNQNTPFSVWLNSLDSNGQLVNSFSKTTTLAAGDTAWVVFDSTFIARPEGLISCTAYSSLVGDEIATNDTFILPLLTVVKTYDFSLVPINTKDTILANLETYKPFVALQNNSRIDTDSAFVSLWIKNPLGEVVYNRTLKSYPSLNGGVDSLLFPEFLPTVSGGFTGMYSVFSITDQNPFNDSLEISFYSQIKFDIKPLAFIKPVANDTFYLPEDILDELRFSIENLGEQDTDTIGFEVNLYQSSTLLKTSKIEKANVISGLGQRVFVILNYFNGVSFEDEVYTLECISNYEKDQVQSNDTLRIEFVTLRVFGLAKKLDTEFVTISPNPFNTKIDIEIKDQNMEHELHLMNQLGQEISSYTITKNASKYSIQADNLPSGIYYLKVSNKDKIFVAKLIKQ